ncbi:MAG: hypothetical protein D6701_12680, partial [Gemmatimonadetes bacterium]
MNAPAPDALRRRVVRIAVAIVVIAVGVPWAGATLRSRGEPTPLADPLPPEGAPTAGEAVRAEAGVFEMTVADLAALDAETAPGPVRTRRLPAYYARRAYPGAPPVVPHEVDRDEDRAPDCLACHARGGYVPAQRAYAPVSPHPEFESCLQCHVPQRDVRPFAGNSFR